MVQITLEQTVLMGIYIMLGYILYKTGKISNEGSKTLANVLVFAVIPSVILKNMFIPYTAQKFREFGISALLGFIATSVSLLYGALRFRKDNLANFATGWANIGFFGLPLVSAIFGDFAVFYAVSMILIFNFTQFTYGVFLLSRDRRYVSFKRILTSHMTIVTLIGLFVFLSNTSCYVPEALLSVISGLAALNVPLAMLILGVYLAQSDLKEMFTNLRFYRISLSRAFIVPLITLGIFCLIPLDYTIKTTILILASTPVGCNIAVYSQLFGGDYKSSCLIVTQSTVLSLVSLPVMVAVIQKFLV